MYDLPSFGTGDDTAFTIKQVKHFIKVTRANVKTGAREEWNAKIGQAARQEREQVNKKAREHIERIRAAKMKKRRRAQGLSEADAKPDPAGGVDVSKTDADDGYLQTAPDDADGDGDGAPAGSGNADDDDGYLQTAPDEDLLEEAREAFKLGKPMISAHMRILVVEAEDTIKKELNVELDRLIQAARMQARTQAQQEVVQKLSRKRNEHTRSRKKAAGPGKASSKKDPPPQRNMSYTRAQSPVPGNMSYTRAQSPVPTLHPGDLPGNSNTATLHPGDLAIRQRARGCGAGTHSSDTDVPGNSNTADKARRKSYAETDL